jgi:hypothetical protein
MLLSRASLNCLTAWRGQFASTHPFLPFALAW